jgi:hypothetical protein
MDIHVSKSQKKWESQNAQQPAQQKHRNDRLVRRRIAKRASSVHSSPKQHLND